MNFIIWILIQKSKQSTSHRTLRLWCGNKESAKAASC